MRCFFLIGQYHKSASPKRRSDEPRGTKVESLQDALAVMRAHKVREKSGSKLTQLVAEDKHQSSLYEDQKISIANSIFLSLPLCLFEKIEAAPV